MVATARPQVVLMDLRMPIFDGVAATRRLRADHPDVQVIALTTFDDDVDMFAALRAGAIGYLLKDVSGETLFAAVRMAARGELFLPPPIATKVVAELTRIADSPQARPQPLPHPLSERELDVLHLIAAGKSNGGIAATLVVAVSTVKAHINSIFGKLDVTSRTQALVRARAPDPLTQRPVDTYTVLAASLPRSDPPALLHPWANAVPPVFRLYSTHRKLRNAEDFDKLELTVIQKVSYSLLGHWTRVEPNAVHTVIDIVAVSPSPSPAEGDVVAPSILLQCAHRSPLLVTSSGIRLRRTSMPTAARRAATSWPPTRCLVHPARSTSMPSHPSAASPTSSQAAHWCGN